VVVPVLDPRSGRPGFSGRSVVVEDPRDPRRRVSVALALDRAHEFGHAFARLVDEYLDDDDPPAAPAARRASRSPWVSNVAPSRRCDDLPWRHLLHGAGLNTTRQLVGAFGTPAHGFHPELRCLMNGTHDNAGHYGGDGALRSRGRLCNYCRELTAFRILERTNVLPDPGTSFGVWIAQYRAPFYARFGVSVPDRVPQINSAGEPWFEACQGTGPTAATGARP
jgi:hypothetical protein